MSLILNALNLFSAPPGGLVYHMVTLFAIEAALGMASGQWQRTRQKGPFRMAMAFGGLFLMRLVLMLVALLAWQGFLDPATLVPPLERFFDVAGVVLLCWAFVLPALDSPDFSRLFLIANLGLATMASLVLIPLWYLDLEMMADLNYNGYWQDIIWGIWKLALFGMACLILLWRASRERGLLLSVFTCLLFGSFLHQTVVWLAPQFYRVAHIAGWERLANLVSFPLLAVTVYRLVIAEMGLPGHEPKTVDERARDEMEGFLPLLKATQKTGASLELPVVLESAVEGTAQALQADMCAIAFPADEKSGQFHLAAMYPRWKRGEDLPLTLDDQLIQPAVTRREPIVTESTEGDAQVMRLYAQMGFNAMGPLLIQPLPREQDLIGLLILGNPQTKRPFSTGDLRLSRLLADQITAAIENARLYQKMQAKAEQLAWTLRNQEELLSQRRAELEARLKRKDEEIQRLNEELRVRQMKASQAQENLETEVSHKVHLEAELNQKEEQIRRLAEALQAREVELDQTRTRLEAELKEATARIKRLVKVIHRQKESVKQSEEQRAKDQFIASISQELRTPMTSIKGYTDLLLGESVGAIADMQRKFLQRIKANVERMDSMLNDLIGVSAIDAGQLKLQIQPLEMAEVIENAISGVRAQIEEKEILLDVDMDEDLPLVQADADYAHQIMTNLLLNACKCSPAKGKVSIKVTAYTRGELGDSATGYLLVSITDSGGGIAPEDQSKVFDRFYRADRPLIAGLGETGVGLSIVKSLVEAHKGRIWVESKMGVGSTFNYILPIAQEERAR